MRTWSEKDKAFWTVIATLPFALFTVVMYFIAYASGRYEWCWWWVFASLCITGVGLYYAWRFRRLTR